MNVIATGLNENRHSAANQWCRRTFPLNLTTETLGSGLQWALELGFLTPPHPWRARSGFCSSWSFLLSRLDSEAS